ncbi:DUF4169 family protein [Rhizobium lemnae]|uniref:DUF4169 family protein n=1 Tax=Rhizobium lemnae TaxID=1214924 RepID=A0ABV8ECB2_9HYPH|nr:DUF4169 family protein [Rhizobium lemnae]MCJ8510686.1 DUF4169 family protein [Rhizobium lemnae]
MCADIINLKSARKVKARSEKERQAEQNRITFGRTKQEKSLTRALNEKASKQLDQGKLEKNDEAD